MIILNVTLNEHEGIIIIVVEIMRGWSMYKIEIFG